ncbi:hypothetical protein [Microbacterium karelineae]|uniref:hypothetical protein n=1 Tax=Microbacterium karelineae TaxID=2654283 RepID=UPI0012EAAF78|nr:hypothetical protein [Microbacterium karelineae]
MTTTIDVDVSDELRAALTTEAAAQGLELNDLLLGMIHREVERIRSRRVDDA